MPDQGASKIPVTEVTLKDSALVLKVDSIRASYTGTIRDFADDVLAVVDYLNARQEIDPNKIGLIGHKAP